LYQENDWVYVISEENREGFIPHSYCAQYGSQMAELALNVRKKLPRNNANSGPNNTASGPGKATSMNGLPTTAVMAAAASPAKFGQQMEAKRQTTTVRAPAASGEGGGSDGAAVNTTATSMSSSGKGECERKRVIWMRDESHFHISAGNSGSSEVIGNSSSSGVRFGQQQHRQSQVMQHQQQQRPLHYPPGLAPAGPGSLASESSSQPSIHPFYKVRQEIFGMVF